MKSKLGKCVLSLLGVFAVSSSIFATSLEQQIQPKSDDNFTEARFRLWLPEKAQRVSGLIVLVPGLQSDGLDLVNEPQWQNLATKWNFGLLGCTFRDNAGTYYLASKGTGGALLEALAELSVSAKHPEIKAAPLVMWGYSAGGQFGYNFTAWAPERVIAFIAVKGGYYDAAPDSRSRSVPALFFAGEKDKSFRVQNITSVFQTNRRQGAFWCLAVEPNEGHSIGKTDDFALSFLDAVIGQRLDQKRGRLRALNRAKAWLGNISSHQIASASTYLQPAEEAVWLPDEATALRWKEFTARKELTKISPTESAFLPVPAMQQTTVSVQVMLGILVVIFVGFGLFIRLHRSAVRK